MGEARRHRKKKEKEKGFPAFTYYNRGGGGDETGGVIIGREEGKSCRQQIHSCLNQEDNL